MTARKLREHTWRFEVEHLAQTDPAAFRSKTNPRPLRTVARCVTAAVLSVALSSQAFAVCKWPPLQRFIRDNPALLGEHTAMATVPADSISYQSIQGTDLLRWMAVSWGSHDGAIFVIDCEGNALAGLWIGVPDVQRDIYLPDGTYATPVIHVTNWGSGILFKTVSLFQYSHSGIRVVWQHDLDETVSGWSTAADYERTSHWRQSPDRLRIEVTRKASDYSNGATADDGTTLRPMDHQSYCWSGKQHSYNACTTSSETERTRSEQH